MHFISKPNALVLVERTSPDSIYSKVSVSMMLGLIVLSIFALCFWEVTVSNMFVPGMVGVLMMLFMLDHHNNAMRQYSRGYQRMARNTQTILGSSGSNDLYKDGVALMTALRRGLWINTLIVTSGVIVIVCDVTNVMLMNMSEPVFWSMLCYAGYVFTAMMYLFYQASYRLSEMKSLRAFFADAIEETCELNVEIGSFGIEPDWSGEKVNLEYAA